MKKPRNTVAKSKITELIQHSGTALSSNEVHVQMSELCDRATVYRVLGRLVEEGAVHKVIDTDGVVKYAPCDDCSAQHRHDHIHFSCESCQVVSCLEEVVPRFDLPKGYVVESINFTVSGLCPKCSASK